MSSGATWVSVPDGGGVVRSVHAGQVLIVDGTDLAAEKAERDYFPLAEVWDGSTWSTQETPHGGHFCGVSCTAADACTAAGSSNDGATLAESKAVQAAS